MQWGFKVFKKGKHTHVVSAQSKTTVSSVLESTSSVDCEAIRSEAVLSTPACIQMHGGSGECWSCMNVIRLQTLKLQNPQECERCGRRDTDEVRHGENGKGQE